MLHRLEALDLLRGLSVIGMILVVTPGAWNTGYSWLSHAEWEGIVAIDMIAPAFMFCVGFVIPISLTKRIKDKLSTVVILRQILIRGCLLILIGLFIHWSGNTDVSTLRLPGVLQRIGITFMFASALVLFLYRSNIHSPRSVYTVLISTVTVLLLGLWILFYFVPVPEFGTTGFSSDKSWSSYIDQSIFGIHHMWEWGKTNGMVTYDPDGIICSIATCANVLIGVVIGEMYLRQSHIYTKRNILLIGGLLVFLGLLISPICPIVKKLWTSSFVLVSSGVSLIAFALLSWGSEGYYLKPFKTILENFGANALFAFSISWLGLFWYLNIEIYSGESIRSIGYNAIHSVVPSENLSSLLFGVVYILTLNVLLSFMRRKEWYLRV